MTDHIAEVLRGAGWTQVIFTVESGVDSLLERYRADYSTDDVRKAFAIAKKSELSTVGYFSVGCPGEARETALKTIEFIKNSSRMAGGWESGRRYPEQSFIQRAKGQAVNSSFHSLRTSPSRKQCSRSCLSNNINSRAQFNPIASRVRL